MITSTEELFYELWFKNEVTYRDYHITIDPIYIDHLHIDVSHPDVDYDICHVDDTSRSLEAGVIHVKYWIDKNILNKCPIVQL